MGERICVVELSICQNLVMQKTIVCEGRDAEFCCLNEAKAENTRRNSCACSKPADFWRGEVHLTSEATSIPDHQIPPASSTPARVIRPFISISTITTLEAILYMSNH